MHIRLTIKSIIRWEQLRGKSFYLMDYTNAEDFESLLYTTSMSARGEKTYTFAVFRQTLSNEKVAREMVTMLQQEIAVLNQFRKKLEENPPENSDSTPGYISEFVSMLVMSGLDAHYALEEMELCDLVMYIEAYERQRKEQMEGDRLWTYLSIIPHVGTKRIPIPRDLYIFPWEYEETKKEAQRAIKEDMDDFEAFMKTKKSDYYGR